MIKKALIGTSLLALGSYMWLGTSMGSYVSTAYHQASGYVWGQVPIEFEIKRAKDLIDKVVPDIRETKKQIAEEEVRIARLETEVEKIESNLNEEKVAILAIRGQLAKGLTAYKIGGKTLSNQALENMLNRRFNSYKRVDEMAKAKREILESRRQHVEAARAQYDNLVESKQQLETELAALEAEHKLIEAKKVGNEFVIDGSRVARVRKLMDQIHDRLEVEKKLSESDGELLDSVRSEDIPPADLTDQIDDYFKSATEPVSGTKSI